MRIRTQFIITMLLFSIILVVIAASAIITSRQVGKASEREKVAGSIAQGASELSYLSNDYLIYLESQQLKRWQSRFASFSNQVASLDVEKPEQQVLVRNIKANEQRLKQVFDSVASAVGNLSRNRSTALDLPFLQVSWSRMAVQSQGLVSDASRLSQLLHQQKDQLTETRTMLMYLMVGLFGAFLLASYLITYRRILKSVAALQAGTAVIGSGNLDVIIEEKRNDEIGDLSRAFNQMTINLKSLTASKADLEREVIERKRAEEALREAHERAVWLARFPEQNPNPIIRASAEGTVLYCNPATSGLRGWTCEVGRPLQDQLFPLVGRAMAEGKEVQQDVHVGERSYIAWAVPFPGERYANIYARDITQRKHAEDELKRARDELEIRVRKRTLDLEKANEALRHLSSRLMSAQEDERKRIAGELHDTIGGCMGAIRFKVEGALQQIGETPAAATESLRTIMPIIQEGIDECRRIQQDLRPSILDDLGLLAALSWFSRRFQTIYSAIQIKQEIGIEEGEIPNALKIVIYRIIQEAMNNIVKHSKADQVFLALRKADQAIQLVVRDNGHGFMVEKILSRKRSSRGLGLDSMRERTELAGGSFTIESTDSGTVIQASWPLSPQSSGGQAVIF
jgi:signal transduction histidine kinase